jgi:hypothetical protein
MALFNIIFVSLFIAAWMALGLIPWVVTSVLTRGHAGMAYLPLCLLAGVAGGMLVPFLGFTGTGGIWLSMLAALLLPSILMVARRYSLGFGRASNETPVTRPSSEAK